MATESSEPTASGEITIEAAPSEVYATVTDLGTLAEFADEYYGFRWLGGATVARAGAKFKGRNRNGFRRWSTTSTITDAERDTRFAFEVKIGPIDISRWQYDFEPDGDGGCRVVERTWNRAPHWFRVVTAPFSGVAPGERDGRNDRHIAATLRNLKTRLEG